MKLKMKLYLFTPSGPHFDSLTILHTTSTLHEHNHIPRLQRRARTPSYHLSRSERAIRAICRLHVPVLSPPMVCLVILDYPASRNADLSFPHQAPPLLPRTSSLPFYATCAPVFTVIHLGIRTGRPASRRGYSLQAVPAP